VHRSKRRRQPSHPDGNGWASYASARAALAISAMPFRPQSAREPPARGKQAGDTCSDKVAMSLDGANDMAGAATAVSAAAANTHHRFGAFGDPNLLGVNTVRGFSTRDFHGV
jgi:hypothetical protein